MYIPKAIEGDYLQTKENGLFFDVKGLKHPKDRTICFIRFYPDPKGDRRRNNNRYSKIYDIKKRYSFLEENNPQYLFFSDQFDMKLQGVKNNDIKKVYNPREYFEDLKRKKILKGIEKDSFELCLLFIEEGDLPPESIGITGSQMVGLNKQDSDIDLVIYGTDVGLNFQNQLSAIFASPNGCLQYTFEEYKSHYKFRAGGSGISFNDFMKSEKRKLHQGIYKGIEFFIRHIKSPQDWEGSYYDYKYKNMGKIRLTAEIIDAKDAIFTPATYKLNVLRILDLNSSQNSINIEDFDLDEIKVINSYRGRFCEHARKGEVIMAEGKFEKVFYKNKEPFYRVLLGNNKTDKMILLAK